MVLDFVLPRSFLVHGDFLGRGPRFSLSAVMPLGCLEGCHETLRSEGLLFSLRLLSARQSPLSDDPQEGFSLGGGREQG